MHSLACRRPDRPCPRPTTRTSACRAGASAEAKLNALPETLSAPKALAALSNRLPPHRLFPNRSAHLATGWPAAAAAWATNRRRPLASPQPSAIGSVFGKPSSLKMNKYRRLKICQGRNSPKPRDCRKELPRGPPKTRLNRPGSIGPAHAIHAQSIRAQSSRSTPLGSALPANNQCSMLRPAR